MRIQLMSHKSGNWNMEFVKLGQAVEEIVTGQPIVVYLSHDVGTEMPEISLIFEGGVFTHHGLGHQGIQDLFCAFRCVRLSAVEWTALFGKADEILKREEVCAQCG